MLTSGLGASEKGVSLNYFNVDKKRWNIRPQLCCNRFLVQLYNFLLVVEMMWKNTLITRVALTYVWKFQSINIKVYLIKSRKDVELRFISFAQTLRNLEMPILHMPLKLGSFQLLFNGSALSVQRLGLERSKKNNIYNTIVKISLLLYFTYYIFYFYKDCILLYYINRLKIMNFTIVYCFERCIQNLQWKLNLKI
jgi:hypothetical protein